MLSESFITRVRALSNEDKRELARLLAEVLEDEEDARACEERRGEPTFSADEVFAELGL